MRISFYYMKPLNDHSLSRREESSKNKLFVCLLVCPHLTDWSKSNVNGEGLFFIKT